MGVTQNDGDDIKRHIEDSRFCDEKDRIWVGVEKLLLINFIFFYFII